MGHTTLRNFLTNHVPQTNTVDISHSLNTIKLYIPILPLILLMFFVFYFPKIPNKVLVNKLLVLSTFNNATSTHVTIYTVSVAAETIEIELKRLPVHFHWLPHIITPTVHKFPVTLLILTVYRIWDNQGPNNICFHQYQ